MDGRSLEFRRLLAFGSGGKRCAQNGSLGFDLFLSWRHRYSNTCKQTINIFAFISVSLVYRKQSRIRAATERYAFRGHWGEDGMGQV